MKYGRQQQNDKQYDFFVNLNLKKRTVKKNFARKTEITYSNIPTFLRYIRWSIVFVLSHSVYRDDELEGIEKLK